MNKTTVISRGEGSEKFELRTTDSEGVTVKALKVGTRKLSKEVADLRANSRNKAAGIVEEGTTPVSTPEEFVAVLDAINSGSFKNKKVQLTSNIDLSNVDYTPINSTDAKAELEFDGNGYSVSGMSVSKHVIVSGEAFYGAGFISQFKGNLTVKNLTFVGCTVSPVEGEDFSGNIAGVVVGYAFGDTVFENITVTGCTVKGFGKIGGILGMGSKPGMKVTFKNCTVVGNTFQGAYNIGPLAGNIQRGETDSFDNVIIENCTVSSNNFELYPVGGPKNVVYKELDTVVSDEQCGLLPKGFPIKGTYALINGYYYGGVAPHYVSYGVSKHDCKLEGEEALLADSEVLI